MTDNLDKILDECIDRINRGESVEACLIDYPEYSEELRHLLSATRETRTAYSFTPSARAKNFHRQRFTAALVVSRERREKRQPLFPWILGWSKVWAPVAAVIVIGLLGYFGLRPALMPPVMIVQPNPEGNFVFLMSDEVNAIGDFEKLNLSISKVSLHLGGDEEKKIEFKLTSFVYDLTVVKAGKSGQYILKPQIGQSGADQDFITVEPEEQSEDNGKSKGANKGKRSSGANQ